MRNSVAKSENFTLTKSVIFSYHPALNRGSFSSLEGKVKKRNMVFDLLEGKLGLMRGPVKPFQGQNFTHQNF